MNPAADGETGKTAIPPKDPEEVETGRKIWQGQGRARPTRQAEEAREREYTVFNGMTFLLLVAPIFFAKLVGLPMAFFNRAIYVWPHEAGHGLTCFWAPRLLCSAAGTLSELFFSIVPAAICLRKPESRVAGLVFLMCTGLTIQHAGQYMQSASNPSGYGFGGVPVTSETHDWTNIFLGLGIPINDAFFIGDDVRCAGHAIAVIFLFAATLAVIPHLYGWRPERLINILSPAAALAAAYVLFAGTRDIEFLLCLPLLPPVVWRIINRA
jgi:hypothetical protein